MAKKFSIPSLLSLIFLSMKENDMSGSRNNNINHRTTTGGRSMQSVKPNNDTVGAAASNMKQRQSILVLHGNRQTGQLLLNRMDKLRKKLQSRGLTLIAPDAPHSCHNDTTTSSSTNDGTTTNITIMRQWWHTTATATNGHHDGLEESLTMIQQLWNTQSYNFVGILGFSMGARLAHFIALLHQQNININNNFLFQGLQFVIMVAGYDAPLPLPLFIQSNDVVVATPTLHVWGETDQLIAPANSESVMKYYQDPQSHIHDGGHHVPMRAANIQAYLHFIDTSLMKDNNNSTSASTCNIHMDEDGAIQLQLHRAEKPETTSCCGLPDDECQMAQQDEIEALSAIFPDEFTLLSSEKDMIYEFPISYQIAIPSSSIGKWPPHPLSLKVTYTIKYPVESLPLMELIHTNNMMEFGSNHMAACHRVMHDAAQVGMPSILACVYAIREFFESGIMETLPVDEDLTPNVIKEETNNPNNPLHGSILSATAERISICNLQGLQIAQQVLKQHTSVFNSLPESIKKGGIWNYTIGLVGKPSAGKSTFFNAATAFARQRDDRENVLGGATMAPHPFTTIDPNIGFCFVPAPPGSCPEDDADPGTMMKIGCTHGRDPQGRRLIPVLLKDVAGLVPGAYQGRGRGNKFLNDLTDADVLIHVVDASGTADTEGNDVGMAEANGSHPLEDLAWIRNELIEWVFTNLMHKWDTIKRRGRGKLSDMFSGYKQSQTILWDVLYAVEKHLDMNEQRDHALDHLAEWDEGDVRRLVSAFLGVRFPMALALNKADLPPAKLFIDDVRNALPIHGALVGVPLSARSEMTFVRTHVDPTIAKASESRTISPPFGVWECLQSSLSLREPVLVFPVNDMLTYAPLPGLTRTAMEDSSLPNVGMISCLQASGGSAPTLWNDGAYDCSSATSQYLLRDVLLMKPGSTVEDVFISLKRLGALGGEFVRAEGARSIGEKSKLVPKNEVIGKANRILKIMTTKRNNWQSKHVVS